MLRTVNICLDVYTTAVTTEMAESAAAKCSRLLTKTSTRSVCVLKFFFFEFSAITTTNSSEIFL